VKFALFWTVFEYYGNISHIKAVRDGQINKVSLCLIIWTRTNSKLWDFHRGKIIYFSQLFVPLRPDVAKRQHAGIRLIISSFNSKMEFGNLHI
jgi:hypothetical protein